MTTTIRTVQGHESEAVIIDPDEMEDGTFNGIRIHPWFRETPEVYVSVGYYDADGNGAFDEKTDDALYYNAIIPREEFVDAILAVFPELKRAEADK